jgi:HTH-type transcriptional regulator/antitoxin HipB
MQVPIQSPAHLGTLVKQLRTKRGLTQQVLANQLGVSQRWLSELELGKGKQFNEKYFEILAMLGVHLFAHADVD